MSGGGEEGLLDGEAARIVPPRLRARVAIALLVGEEDAVLEMAGPALERRAHALVLGQVHADAEHAGGDRRRLAAAFHRAPPR